MKFRVTARGVAVASCLIILLLSGWCFILDPISLLFEVLIIPHWHALGKTEPFAHGYYIMKISFGVVTVMISVAVLCSIVGEYKREKQRDTQDRIGRELKEKEAALASQTAENEALKARVAELESTPKEAAESWEIAKLKMHLEDAETARAGLSDELEVKTLEVAQLRQELKDLKAIHGEGHKLRTMWRYVLELEAQGKPDDVIWAALKGDGFSGITADALLFDGKEATFSAVKKYGEREREAGRRKSL